MQVKAGTAADADGVEFVYLNQAQYDLVPMKEVAQRLDVQSLIAWLQPDKTKQFIDQKPG